MLPLALTMGEPAGIGPEVILKSWLRRHEAALPPAFVYGSAEHFRATAKTLDGAIEITEISNPSDAVTVFEDALPVINAPLKQTVRLGEPLEDNGQCVVSAIESAVAAALAGEVAGLVTAPLHKSVLYNIGFKFEGHTDFIAALCKNAQGTPHSLQMLTDGAVKTIPVTVHIPLKDVKDALTKDLIVSTIEISAAALANDYGIKDAKIAIAGLNPHAGEDGKMGREEIDVIVPAMEAANAAGASLHGPFAADALFSARERVKYDLIICMYHDQALIPLKALNFDKGVNVTLGLPVIRTSPDHGTALAIAGQGIAEPLSMIAAIKEAEAIAQARAGPRASKV